MIRTTIVNPSTHRSLDIQTNAIGTPTLMTLNDKTAFGQFRTASRTTAGTTIIVTPPLDGAIVLTDLLISSDRVAASTVTLQFTDGVNTVVIFSASAADAPVNVGMNFAGRWRGWKNARMELVTTASVNARIAVGYFKVFSPNSKTFSEWNAER